jgi:WD40 repeat protein
LPGYEILGKLGRGGMGVVYKARQIGLDRLVALKMVLTGGHASPAELTRFRTEAEAVARLQHPNIVQIYDVGEHGGLPFFSLEYCAGGSLDRQLDGTPWPAQKAARLVETLAKAVEAAHCAGVVHRDLKPANVLLTKDGQPKITDFGLAKRLDVDNGQTQSGAILGTPSYMAPEQAGGKVKEIGPAADVYALGAILYELLTGRPPFKAATPLDTIMQVVSDEPVPPRQLQSKVPRDIETVCLKCLQKDPRKRYGSARDLAEDLGRNLAGKPVLARPVGRAEQLWRWCRRNPALATAGGLASAATVVTLVTLTVAVLLIGQARDEAIRFGTDNQMLAATERGLRREAERDAAKLHFEQAYAQCRSEDGRLGMLWLSDALLAANRAEATDLEQSIRLQLAGWHRSLHPLRAVLQHQKPITVLAFSPDGKVVLTGDQTGTARLWETRTGKPIGPALHHQALVCAVAFSPDSKTVLTGSHDDSARLWEVATGRPIGEPLRHQGWIQAVAFSPDGKTVLTGAGDRTARLWEAASGRPIGAPLRHRDDVLAVAFSPDGKTLLTAGAYEARLWEAASGKPIGPPLRHPGYFTAVAFSPDGKTVLTANAADKTAGLWQAASGKPIGPLLQHQDAVTAVAFSPDGKTLLTASLDKTARLWDAATGRPIGAPLRHEHEVWAAAFSPDGTMVLTGSQDQTARLWTAATGKPSGAPLQHQGRVGLVAFSPDGESLLTGSEDGTARLWDTETGRPIGPPMSHEDAVFAVAFNPDGKMVLTGGRETARLWAVATGKRIDPPFQLFAPVLGVAFSPDGKRVLTATGVVAQLWETVTGKLVGAPLLHKAQGDHDDDCVRPVAFSPDGKMVLTGSTNKTARLWEAAAGRPIRAPRPYEFPEFTEIVETGKPVGPPLTHQGAVWAVAFSPDGKMVLTGSADKTARLWEAGTGKAIGVPLRHQGEVLAVAFSPDGSMVLTGAQDRTARLWKAGTWQALGRPLRHQGIVTAVAFCPDGRTLLTGSEDKTARLWDAVTGTAVGPPLEHGDGVSAVAFSPAGETILTGSLDGTARLWKAPRPVRGEVERVRLWTQVITGMELDQHGAAHVLDAATWEQRRQRLLELGGSPLP